MINLFDFSLVITDGRWNYPVDDFSNPWNSIPKLWALCLKVSEHL